jgi:hypothetical protein
MGLQDIIRKFSKTGIGFRLIGCCHSYPDVFAIADFYENNRFFEEYYCFECNRMFSKPVDESKMTVSFKEKLKREGNVVHASIKELEERRKNVLRKYYSQ